MYDQYFIYRAIIAWPLHGKVKIYDWVADRIGLGSFFHVCGVHLLTYFPLERAAAAAAAVVVAVKASLWNPVVNHDLISTVVSTSLEKSFPDLGM